MRILIVEDEKRIADFLSRGLQGAGYAVDTAPTGSQALECIHSTDYDLVILDLMLPEGDGLEICRILRGERQTAALPIVMLTAKAGEVDRVLGLEFGADDYVTKPFSPRELVARVRAVLRRSESAEPERPTALYDRGRLRINFDSHEAWLDGRALELSLREFELLKFFVRNPNRVYDRLTILDLVWGNDTYVEPRTVDVHVRRLRLLVERDPANPELIHTVRGVGYKFNDHALDR